MELSDGKTMRSYSAPEGVTINEAAVGARAYAQEWEEVVAFCFLGVPVAVRPDDDPQEIVRRWERHAWIEMGVRK